jgi:hypothetical protein
LRLAVSKGFAPHTYSHLSELRAYAEMQLTAGGWRDAAETLRQMLAVIGETGGYRLACFSVCLAAVEIASDLQAHAEFRLLRAIPVLRRGGGDLRVAEATMLLLSIVRPGRRLRERRHPEEILWDIPPTSVLSARAAMPSDACPS